MPRACCSANRNPWESTKKIHRSIESLLWARKKFCHERSLHKKRVCGCSRPPPAKKCASDAAITRFETSERSRQPARSTEKQANNFIFSTDLSWTAGDWFFNIACIVRDFTVKSRTMRAAPARGGGARLVVAAVSRCQLHAHRSATSRASRSCATAASPSVPRASAAPHSSTSTRRRRRAAERVASPAASRASECSSAARNGIAQRPCARNLRKYDLISRCGDGTTCAGILYSLWCACAVISFYIIWKLICVPFLWFLIEFCCIIAANNGIYYWNKGLVQKGSVC